MNFREMLQEYNGLLEWDAHFRLRSGAIINCKNYRNYKTNLTCHNDHIKVEHLVKRADGHLYPLRVDYIPFESIDCFQIELENEES